MWQRVALASRGQNENQVSHFLSGFWRFRRRKYSSQKFRQIKNQDKSFKKPNKTLKIPNDLHKEILEDIRGYN